MKISYDWLKQFIDLDHTPEEVSLVLTDIGLEVESLEKVQRVPGGLEGLVVGEVKTCIPHPNADRLRVTTVDVGGPEILHIVCGAPNVAAGQRVVVATIGATLYPSEGDPFTINKSKIRGEVSEGMICAEDEIGLGIDHGGIMILPDTVAVGTPAKEYFDLQDDFVYEIGLTPNRADAASHLGVARDLSAYYKKPYRLPQSNSNVAAGVTDAIPVQIESAMCKRYASCVVTDVKVGESPDWLKDKLGAIGLRSINNVVDVTNFVLHGLGQPLHAFDADRIKGGKVVVRQARENESFVTLDGIERKLDTGDLMICDAEKPLCIAGVFGGLESGVTESTQNVFLESAYFDAVSVRKTSKRHGLKTDASFRYERGTDPDIPVTALRYAAELLAEVAGGKVSSVVSDIYPEPVKAFEFDVHYDRVQSLIGIAIPREEIRRIIAGLEIVVLEDTEDTIRVAVPPYRVDVTREVDVIEEVLRIYGYNNIPIDSQIKASLNPFPKPDKELIQNQVADFLVANGYYEIMNNSLTRLEYVQDPETAVRILNPLSSDLNTMRQNLLFSMLESVDHNQKRKLTDLKFFEFGKSYHTSESSYKERYHLGLAITGKEVGGHWTVQDESISFYHLKGVVDAITQKLGISDVQVQEIDADDPYLAYGLKYVRNQQVLVSFGEIDKKALQRADVSGKVFYADFDWDAVMKNLKKHKIFYQEISKFPAVRRDLALLVDTSVDFETLRQIAMRVERKLLKEVNVFDVYKGDKLPEGKKSYALSFLLQDEDKTLGDKQIDAIVKKLIHNFEKETGAEVRK